MSTHSSAPTERFDPPSMGRRNIGPELPIRLLLDARKITDGGIGRYTASLLSALEDQPIAVAALVNDGQRKLLPTYVTPLVTHLKPFSISGFVGLSSQIPWGLFDLYHSPHFLLPRSVPIPTVVTVHDAIPVSHPTGIMHQRLSSYLLTRLASKATTVVTVSASSALALRKLTGLETKVIPNILPFAAQSSRELAGFRSSERYVVGVFSNDKPHKGMALFAEACRSCNVRGVAVGRGAASLKGNPSITCLSEMAWEKLLEVYQGATALVVSSAIEGFCLPALEAKALGIRVVSTPEPAVKEILDENDEVALDFSGSALSEALARALSRSDRDEQENYRWDRAEEFYPGRVAKQMMNVYHAALGYNE